MQPRITGSILCALGLFSATICGQTTPASPPTFASEPYFIKSISTVTSMNADGTGTRLLTYAIAIQSEAALRDVGVLTLVFASQSEHADFIYARVVHTDGTIQETPVDGAIQQPAPITQQAPFYSDLQTKQLPVKSMRVGDQLQWQARFTEYHAEVPNQFWGQNTFSQGAVALDQSYELRIPAGLHLTVWTNPRAGTAFTESSEAGQHIYRWTHSDLHPTVGPEAEAAKKAEGRRIRTPDEEVDILEGKLPDFAWTTFPDWATVGAWYRGLIADRITPDDTIKAKVAELTAGKSTDIEKAQAVYNFVSTRIRYIGVAFGIGRYQPHTAAEVFANQYGDCKDKHILLASMFSVLGLHAEPVLVGAGIRFQSAVPSPTSFNHLITRLSLDGKDVWLDSTEETGEWGALLRPIRDQDALLIPTAGSPAIVHTPVELPFPQLSTATMKGTLGQDLTSESTFTFTFHSDDELIIRAVLRSVSPAQYSAFVQGLMANLGFGGTTSQPEINHFDDPSQPLQITFHYHRVKEKDWGENRITAAFQPINLPSFTVDQPATSAILLGSPRSENSSVTLQLPDGWNAVPPNAVHAHAAFANCDVTYSIEGHVLSAERRLTILQTKVPVKDAKQYQTWYEDCGASGVPYIDLLPAPKVGAVATAPEPKAPETPAGPATSAKPPDPKAADLIQQAQQSLRAFDLDAARKDLDQANQINPSQPHLWSTYAGVASMLGMRNQALEDMQRELTYHPDEVEYYPGVVQQQQYNGDANVALSTLRAWVKAAPGNPEAALALARQLLELKSFREALNAARTVIYRPASSSVDLTDLKIVAAKAQVGLGQASPAANEIAPLLKTATDPVQINDIASILAQAGTHLPEAEAAEAKLLDTDETASTSWTAEAIIPRIQSQLFRMFSEWDTMALILFHQGKLAQAAGYSIAAFRNSNAKDARTHLTAINAALHSPAATATLRGPDQTLRTIPLGPAHGHQGVVFVTLILSGGKVIDSRTEDSASPGPRLADPAEFLKNADLKPLFPPASKARILRTGFVNCHSGICELVLSPFDGIQIINVGPPSDKNPSSIVIKNLPLTH